MWPHRYIGEEENILSVLHEMRKCVSVSLENAENRISLTQPKGQVWLNHLHNSLLTLQTCHNIIHYRKTMDQGIEYLTRLHRLVSIWYESHVFRTTGNYSAITVLHNLQFTVLHALGFSVFSSRILATDLSQSQCNFKSHLMSSFHSLIPLLPLFCSCLFRRLDCIQFLCYKAYIPAGWPPETRLSTLNYCSLLLGPVLCPIYNPLGTDHTENTASIVKEACLLVRCLLINVLLLQAYASLNYIYRVVA
jgi:hypothetical protein